MRAQTAAVITTRNEAQSIGRLVVELLGHDWVIVVDDQSTDGTAAAAQRAGACVISTSARMGIGPSLLLGWARALELGATRVVQLDAGGSHEPWEAHRLLTRLRDADVVVGSRYRATSVYKGRPMRQVMSQLAAAACNHRAGACISDWTSGYRAFRADALRLLLVQPYQCRMHGWQIEVLDAALRLGLTVGEAPISYTAGRSAFNARVAREAVGAWRRL